MPEWLDLFSIITGTITGILFVLWIKAENRAGELSDDLTEASRLRDSWRDAWKEKGDELVKCSKEIVSANLTIQDLREKLKNTEGGWEKLHEFRTEHKRAMDLVATRDVQLTRIMEERNLAKADLERHTGCDTAFENYKSALVAASRKISLLAANLEQAITNKHPCLMHTDEYGDAAIAILPSDVGDMRVGTIMTQGVNGETYKRKE